MTAAPVDPLPPAAACPRRAPRWQRALRATTAALLGLGMLGVVASAAFWGTRPDPTRAELADAGRVLVPEAQIGDDALVPIDQSAAGPNERRARFEPAVEVEEVATRAAERGYDLARPDDDELVVDLGGVLAQVRPSQLDVVHDDRAGAAAWAGLAGLLGATVGASRSLRRSGRAAVRKQRLLRATVSGFGLPLGLLLGLGWAAAVAAVLFEPGTPLDLTALALGGLLLLFFVWAPLGAVVAVVVAVIASARPRDPDPGG